MLQPKTVEGICKQMKRLEEEKNLKRKEYFAQFDTSRMNPRLAERIKKNGLKGLKPIEEIIGT